jgi:signal transduction histidine kinase
MFKSLYLKLAAVLLILFFLVGISFILISLFITEKYQQEANQKLNRDLAENIVTEKLIIKDSRINEEALKNIFHMIMVINPSIEIYLLDPEGNILAFSADPGKVKRKSVDLGPVKTWLGGKAKLPILGDDPRKEDGKKVFNVARISNKGRLEGYLYVILGGQSYDTVIQKIQGSYILQMSTWVISTSLMVALIAGLLIFALLTRRLKRLATAMDSYKNGLTVDQIDLQMIQHKHSADEIDRLDSTFKQMAERIEEQIEKLKKSDTVRREMVANVSHDLRTPLTTLSGYMETLLLKDSSLSAEERKNYLKIAIRHCDRLSTLVANLFELAKLDAQDAIIRTEPFSLSELVQDVVQKFKLIAREKHINIITNIGKDVHFVVADIALIERLLENLIENALRHTPEDGSISIVLTPELEDIMVQVSDTGRGIPEKDLPRIFDRFYQQDKSRKEKQAHSGLGLAITRRILELHKRSIQVQSLLNSGTTFTFHLPIHKPS